MNVTVVGAGIVGYAVAYELASRGVQVRIVDPRGAGLGATRASAGVLAPYIEGHSDALLKIAVCGLACYESFLARVASESGQLIEYRRTGTVQVARDAAHASELERVAGALTAAGVEHALLDGKGVKGVEPALADNIRAGLHVPEHGYVIPAQMISALAEASRRHGVTWIPHAVQGIEGNDTRRPRVTTADDVFETDAVVIAAGSWSGQIAVPPVPVRPIRGQLVHLHFHAPPITRIVWGSNCYLVPWRDGSVLVGATVEDVGFDEGATVSGISQLLASAADLLPGAASTGFKEVRVGLRPRTPDELPVIGTSSTMRGVYYATGHYRNGVLLAPLTALMLADLMLEGRERQELSVVRPDRFGL